jgi:(1->4)-alpha-D-glucan 1-alpha-D-glucosylmutase
MKECIEDLLQREARVPASTYRMQMHAGFTFSDAEKVVPYLKRLGIGDLYASPIFEARPGSTHGYDVTRHDRLNSELGGDEGFYRMSAALREAGMGLLLDIVPNHMGIGPDSVWWQDVLENGRSSQYAEFFDIDWTPLKPDMQDKLLLPILGKQYGEELESKHIQVVVEDGWMRVQYYEHRMPVATRTLPVIFPEADDAAFGVPQGFRELMKEMAHIPPHWTTEPNLVQQRRQQLAELRPKLRDAMLSAEMQPVLAKALERINGVEGEEQSFDRLHALLEAQPYRLAYWRVSAEEINYRRFFDVNDLVGLRMENPEVFAQTHCLIRKLLAEDSVNGLRIDHCDGMFNPRQYLIRLQLLFVAARCAGPTAKGPTALNGIEVEIREKLRGYDWAGAKLPLYVVVEKILEPRESLPREWPVQGTSGYDFVHFANQVFIRNDNVKKFDELYAGIVGERRDPDEIIYSSKLKVMETSLASEVYVLTNLLSRIAANERRARDFTDNLLEESIRETIACFPVYRTYFDDRGQYTESDLEFIRRAVNKAKRLNPAVDRTVFDFLEDTLRLGHRSGGEIDQHKLYFALKFQQLTGPVMAKGVEDTSFYVWNRFVSSNEVGSSMKAFGIPLDVLHASNRERLEHSPDAMLTTSTHDTKRSEDVRARLNVLSEMPYTWAGLVRRWQRMNAKYKRTLEDGRVAPDNNEEYLLYQTIVGAWPWEPHGIEDREFFLERLQRYASKALSEAKVNLSWIDPNPQYVEAVQGWLADLLLPGPRGRETRFVETLNGVLPVVSMFGAVNSLAQLVLKIASPGVPDFYQGTEMWEMTLVDPDNRRPVDYNKRSALLEAMESKAEREGAAAVCAEVLDSLQDGRVKLWTMHRALAARNEHWELFRRGEYLPLSIERDKQHNAIAFLRRGTTSGTTALVVLPRFACTLMGEKAQLPLGDAWGKAAVRLPHGSAREMTDVFTGERVRVDEDGTVELREVLRGFPVAMLVGAL